MSTVYQPLTGQRFAELEGQPISLEGSKSFGMMQHMMAGVMDENFNRLPFFYLAAEASGIHEIVVYCAKSLLPQSDRDSSEPINSDFSAADAQRIRVRGVLRSTSGPGKGGHGDHTEYYIVADQVEAF